VNHKRVYRLYGEEGLAVRRGQRKRLKAEARRPLALPSLHRSRRSARRLDPKSFRKFSIQKRPLLTPCRSKGRVLTGDATAIAEQQLISMA